MANHAESGDVSQLEICIFEKDERALKAMTNNGLSGEKLKSRAGSVDERTLNDPNFLLKEERDATRAAITNPDEKTDDFPDGGVRAWLCVLGVSVTHEMLVLILYS